MGAYEESDAVAGEAGEADQLGQIQVGGGKIWLQLTEIEAVLLTDLLLQVQALLQPPTPDEPGEKLGAQGLTLSEEGLALPEDGAADTPSDQVVSAAELEAMVGLGAGPVSAPTDAALARLLPDAYHDDAQASSDFRRFTELDLRERKQASLQQVLATLNPAGCTPGSNDPSRLSGTALPSFQVQLSLPQGRNWLVALNDVRLVLGVRLGFTQADEPEPAAGQAPAMDAAGQSLIDGQALQAVYEYLTYLQEGLVQAVCLLEEQSGSGTGAGSGNSSDFGSDRGTDS